VPKTGIDLLDEVLCVLDDLATQEDREHLAELRQRVEARRLRVLIAGDAKRGKSPLVNQMIGRDLLPTGVTPVTAVVTTVRKAEADDHIESPSRTAVSPFMTWPNWLNSSVSVATPQ
jgi:predicted GTPase